MPVTEKFNLWWSQIFSDENWVQWVLVIPTFFAAWFAIYFGHALLKKVVLKKRDKRPWLEFINAFLSASHWPFFLAFAIYISLLVSPIPYEYKALFNRAFGVAIILQMGLWLNTTLGYFINDVMSREADASKTTVLRAVSVAAKMALWIAIFLLLLDNIGVNITTLVAGLGVGGIAVALGVQKIMGDIFASLSIVMDKPFVIGDLIIVGDHKGTVEDIGIKTTRIRSISGERIIFSNSDLLESRIRNYTQMHHRRVEFEVGITYETPIEKVKLATKLAEEAVTRVGNTRFEWARFSTFAGSSLNISVAYYVNSPAGETYQETHEKVCLGILDSYNKNKIEFAYPTQRLVYDSNTLEAMTRASKTNSSFESKNI